MRELTRNELDQVSGAQTEVPLAGSNPQRQNGFFTGASLTGLDNIVTHAFPALVAAGHGASADGQTKPPTTVPGHT